MPPQKRNGPSRTLSGSASDPLDPETPVCGAQTVSVPSQDLLDRALRGWERFLDSFEEPAHE